MEFSTLIPERLVMDWQTVHNDTDCGVFVMHMSTCMGGGTATWNAKIKPESVSITSCYFELFFEVF